MTQVMRACESGGAGPREVKSSLPGAAAAATAARSRLQRALQRVRSRVPQPISRYALLKVARSGDYSPVMNELAALKRR